MSLVSSSQRAKAGRRCAPGRAVVVLVIGGCPRSDSRTRRAASVSARPAAGPRPARNRRFAATPVDWTGRGERSIGAMSIETVDTLIVGAGQAGLAMSEHLSRRGVPHLVLERHRIAERWRSERWDSLVANGPAWHDRFPDAEFADAPTPTRSPPRTRSRTTSSPTPSARAPPCATAWRCGRSSGTPAVRASASRPRTAPSRPRRVVAATGAFQHPVVPEHRAPGCGSGPDPLQRLPEPRAAAGRGRAGGRLRLVGRADRRRAAALGPTRPPLRRPARAAAAQLPRAGLLLVAGRARALGRGRPRPGHRARDHRGERRRAAAPPSTSGAWPRRGRCWSGAPRLGGTAR